ncbi:MAG: hypothetical protein A3G19_01665 [Sulfuricurvum sp. RIFCSPLOWO2_12_FULL_43_24]|nr:MAG: hypothetical protein A3G19_01665 [Sulfuricurvum sp. RIFCSPLOWO2_12_FULL_43_24]
MTIKAFNRIAILLLIILLLSNLIYKAIISPYNFFDSLDINLKVLISFVLMYFLGDFLLSKKIINNNVPNNTIFTLGMIIFLFSIYTVSDIGFYSDTLFMFRNFSVSTILSATNYNLIAILLAWVAIMIANLMLKHSLTSSKKDSHQPLHVDKIITYLVLLFGFLFIWNSCFMECIGVWKLANSNLDVMNKSAWFSSAKFLIIQLLSLLIYWRIILSLQTKYPYHFTNNYILLITAIFILVGAYSFNAFMYQLTFITLLSERYEVWSLIHILFMPILIGFYFFSLYITRKKNT